MLQRPAVLLHGREHKLAVALELRRQELQHGAVLRDGCNGSLSIRTVEPFGCEHQLAVALELRRGVLQRPAVLLHGRTHQRDRS